MSLHTSFAPSPRRISLECIWPRTRWGGVLYKFLWGWRRRKNRNRQQRLSLTTVTQPSRCTRIQDTYPNSPGAHCNERWLGIFGKHNIQKLFFFKWTFCRKAQGATKLLSEEFLHIQGWKGATEVASSPPRHPQHMGAWNWSPSHSGLSRSLFNYNYATK